MKTINILLLSLIFSNVFSQEVLEKEVKTEVDEVTVFLDGAQVVRKKTVDLTKGKSIIKFVNLSPFIDAKSVQVKAEGELTVLSVNHQQNYLDKMEKSAELTDLEKRLETIEDKIKLESTYLSIIKDELSFLQENRDIGGKNEQISVVNLQQASDFYSNKLTALKLKEIERNKTLKTLNEQKNDLKNQIKTLTSKKEYPTGEILVKVDARNANKFSLELTYLVGNAGWFPSYDIRAKNINEPVQLIYKANVKQDTKVDWSNVKLKFSSADPNVSGVAPELQTYFLNYNTLPPTYKLTTNSVRGKVVDSNGEPLPGANVVVEGTTIGTVTDLDGNYSITIPNNSSQLTYSFIGFNSKTLPISNSVMNIALEEDLMQLEEVVVVGYGSRKKVSDALQGRVAGVNVDNSIKIRGTSSLAIPTAQVENQTTVDFEINTPYSIKSDNKNYTVDMEFYELPAFYQYYSVPKVDKDAFLIANIIDWEKYNLLEGEANVFFEETYVGKTLMDVRYASDTLEISLGRDKKVNVNREKIKDFTDKQFIGNKKEETRAWKTTVKNNKNQAINMIILDQVPVSTIEEIEVNVQNISGAKQNSETGEIKWEFELKPNDKKEFDLKYTVKYPKYRNLIVE
ncbi:mucoidy inhibitor MuiA family protein [uncultured Draconibacterium sp.]|uniref:mucoidy inhibitor MuiA family protein n=1 Tax=uncultured Draconibacterium sp. TaxID=1573823 RepID=UPI0032609B83